MTDRSENPPTNGPPAAAWFSIWLHVASFSLLSILVFAINADVLFLRWDGTAHLTEAANQFRWGGPLLSFHLDPLRANGDLSYINQYRLLPSMMLGYWLGGPEIARPVSAAVSAIMYFAAILANLRLSGFGRSYSVIAAWAVCILLLPYWVPPPTFIRAWGNLTLLPGFAAGLLAASLFLRIGSPERSMGRDILDSAVIWFGLAWCAVATPAVAVIVGPVVAGFGIVRLACLKSADRKRPAIFAACIAVALLPFAFHALEVHAYSKSSFFSAEMEVLKTGIRQASFFIYIHGEGSLVGEWIVMIAPFGAALAALVSTGALRRIAVAYLAMYAVIFGLVGLFGLFDIGWTGPPLAYIDLTIVPLHVAFALAPLIFALRAAAAFGERFAPVRRILAPVESHTGVALAAAGWILLPLALLHVRTPAYLEHGPWPWPQKITPLVAFLDSKIGLLSDPQFRGRVVSMAGLRGDTRPFTSQHEFETQLLLKTGNDHRANGLWFFGIPTLNSSSHLTSPFFQAVASRLLSAPGVEAVRAHLTFSKFDARLMAAYGTRYAISQTVLPGAHFVGRYGSGTDPLDLYEIDNPNLGGYSALSVERVPDMRTALARLADPGFDPSTRAVVHEDVPSGLVQMTSSRLSFAPDLTTFEARSDGSSLALLPLDFSRCYEFSFRSSGAFPPRVLRANVSQTAILFDRDVEADIRLRFGVFTNPGCRLHDLFDGRALGLGSLAGWWPPQVSGSQ